MVARHGLGLLVAHGLLLVPCTVAQLPDPQEQLKAKLASPFLEKAPWRLDFAAAKAEAAKSGRLIFGYFTTAGP